jgi:hypothetical protein
MAFAVLKDIIVYFVTHFIHNICAAQEDIELFDNIRHFYFTMEPIHRILKAQKRLLYGVAISRLYE